MGKGRDNSGIAFQKETWSKCLEVLKPGGYLLAFWGSRTFHRIACAIEDAGFEIRDVIMWIYWSWFPKSMNIWLAIDKKNWVDNRTGNIVKGVGSNNTDSMKNWLSKSQEFGTEYEERKATNERGGRGTALKPSYEPIIVARKPLEWSCTDNVIKYGVGGINIDECRVGTETISIHNAPAGTFAGWEYDRGSDTESYRDSVGRFPANTILTYDDTDFDEVCSSFPYTKSTWGSGEMSKVNTFKNVKIWVNGKNTGDHLGGLGDSGSASRYFYCAKASKRDRDEGLSALEKDYLTDWRKKPIDNPFLRGETPRKNTHPTVKPCDLMQYLVRLVTPKWGIVLDPFNGSGSTGKAVMYENKDRNKNYKYIGIELTEEYLPIAKARIEYVINRGIEKEKSDPKQEEQTKQRKESALF